MSYEDVVAGGLVRGKSPSPRHTLRGAESPLRGISSPARRADSPSMASPDSPRSYRSPSSRFQATMRTGKRKIFGAMRDRNASPFQPVSPENETELVDKTDVESVGSVPYKRYEVNGQFGQRVPEDGLESDYSVLQGSVSVAGEAFDKHFQQNYDKLYASHDEKDNTSRRDIPSPSMRAMGRSSDTERHDESGKFDENESRMANHEGDGILGDDGNLGDDDDEDKSKAGVVAAAIKSLKLEPEVEIPGRIRRATCESRLGKKAAAVKFAPWRQAEDTSSLPAEPIPSESPKGEQSDMGRMPVLSSLQVERGTPDGSTPWQPREWPPPTPGPNEETSEAISEDPTSVSLSSSQAAASYSNAEAKFVGMAPTAPPASSGNGEVTSGSSMSLVRRGKHRRSTTWSSPRNTEEHLSVETKEKPIVRTMSGVLQQTGAAAPIVPFRLISLARGQEAWQAMIAYDACVRLCLTASASGCLEAHNFLHDGCYLLRTCFGLQQVLLQPGQGSSKGGETEEPSSPTHQPKLSVGTVRVQVRRVFMTLKGGGPALLPSPPKGIKWMKDKVRSFGSNSALAPDGVFCTVRLKSADEQTASRTQPGIGEIITLHPESASDEVLIDVHDPKGFKGRVTVPVSSVNAEHMEKPRWVAFYNESDPESCGKLQMLISYERSGAAASAWTQVGETLAYDIVLDVALRVLGFDCHNLHLHGPWRWLLSAFAQSFCVSQHYANLRYLTHVMFVSTPLEDCLLVIRDLLDPVVQARKEDTLSRQEKRLLADMEEQVSQLLSLTFKNYKSLDESSPTGISDTLLSLPMSAPAPSLAPAVEVYELLYDMESADVQNNLCGYFQKAAKKRCSAYIVESEWTPEQVVGQDNMVASYARMCTLCTQLSMEVQTDIDICETQVFPSCVDLPRLTGEIYDVDLAEKLRTFLHKWPPSSALPCVAELLHATADFQEAMEKWDIRAKVLGTGVNAKDLFGGFMDMWLQDARTQLLEMCRFDKSKGTVMAPPAETNTTSKFVEEMYAKIKEFMQQLETIMMRWPEYVSTFEVVLCDVERGIISALDKQYADFLPLRETPQNKKFNLQKLTQTLRGEKGPRYTVPPQLGELLNSIKRMLELLRPKAEAQMRRWLTKSPPPAAAGGKAALGDRLNEVTVELRAKYKSTLIAIIEKLTDNMHAHKVTNLRKIMSEVKENKGEGDVRQRLVPVESAITEMVIQLDSVTYGRVFVAICRGLWDHMAKDVLQFLENRKENMSWFKSSAAGMALETLDNLFQMHMQKLQGHVLQEKDLDPPRSVLEARAMLSKDAPNGVSESYSIY